MNPLSKALLVLIGYLVSCYGISHAVEDLYNPSIPKATSVMDLLVFGVVFLSCTILMLKWAFTRPNDNFRDIDQKEG